MINGFVDSFEFNYTMPNVTGLFRKKKFQKEMEKIMNDLGWGTFLLEQQRIVHSAHPLLSVALGQYFLESYGNERFKIRWIEPMPQTVQLETEPSSQLPHPQPHKQFPWSLEHDVEAGNSTITVDVHPENELRYEGERVIPIPVKSLDRFFAGCLPYVSEQQEQWFDEETFQLNSHNHLLKTIIKSISEMFLKSERPVYIIDETSWTAYIEHYICERGWGAAHVIDYDTLTYTLEFKIPMQIQFPYTLGLMCGMWERAHGRAYRISLVQENDTFVVKIQSLLEYENQ